MMNNIISEKNNNTLAVDLAKCHTVLAKYKQITEGDLIPILQDIQDAYCYLPMEVVEEISAYTGIPLSKIYGVVTFYAQFHMEPVGKHTIKLCTGTACHIKGAPDIRDIIEDALDIQDGETTQDYKFTYKTVACVGTCNLAPVMMINDRYYGKLSKEKTEDILKSY